MILFFPLLILTLALLIGGIWMIAAGVSGRRVGTHPHCSVCGFDLFGRPADSERCSECGSDLRRHGSYHIGALQRRPAMAWGGAAMVLATVGASVAAVLVLTRVTILPVAGRGAGVNPVTLTPPALAAAAAGRGPVLSGAAVAELIRRAQAGMLTPGELKQTLVVLSSNGPIEKQNPAARQWFEYLVTAGIVPQQQADAYLTGLSAAQLITSDWACTTTEPLRLPISLSNPAGGGGISGVLDVTIRSKDGALMHSGQTAVTTAAPAPAKLTVDPQAKALVNLRGRQNATLQLTWTWNAGSGQPISARPLPMTIVVIPPGRVGQTSSKRVASVGVFGQALDGQIASAIHLQSAHMDEKGVLQLQIKIDSVPENLSFGVFCSYRRTMSRYGFIAQAAGDPAKVYQFALPIGAMAQPEPATSPIGLRLGSDDEAPGDLGWPRYWARDVHFTIPDGGNAASAAREIKPAAQRPLNKRINLNQPAPTNVPSGGRKKKGT